MICLVLQKNYFNKIPTNRMLVFLIYSDKMKKIIIALLLSFLFLFSLPLQMNAQSLQPFNLSRINRDKMNQWQKTGTILAGSGAVLVLTGLVIPRGKSVERYPSCIQDCKNVNDDLKSVLVIGGAASLLASIPLFFVSYKNKEGAVFINPRIQKQETTSEKRTFIYSELSFKMNF